MAAKYWCIERKDGKQEHTRLYRCNKNRLKKPFVTIGCAISWSINSYQRRYGCPLLNKRTRHWLEEGNCKHLEIRNWKRDWVVVFLCARDRKRIENVVTVRY